MRKGLKIADITVILLFSLSFILTVAFLSIIPIASNNAYYMLQFEKNGVGENLNYSIGQLETITSAITGYLFRGKSSMQVYFDGTAVFSDQAISHMGRRQSTFRRRNDLRFRFSRRLFSVPRLSFLPEKGSQKEFPQDQLSRFSRLPAPDRRDRRLCVRRFRFGFRQLSPSDFPGSGEIQQCFLPGRRYPDQHSDDGLFLRRVPQRRRSHRRAVFRLFLRRAESVRQSLCQNKEQFFGKTAPLNFSLNQFVFADHAVFQIVRNRFVRVESSVEESVGLRQRF